MVSTLKDLEAQAKAEKATIAAIERDASTAIRLPSPNDVLERVLDIEARVRQNPTRGREALRRLLKDGHITLTPGPDGVYVAKSEILPLILLLENKNADPGLTRTSSSVIASSPESRPMVKVRPSRGHDRAPLPAESTGP